MNRLFTLGIITASLTLGTIAMAYPTLNGETGIVVLPNALTAANGSVSGAADILFSNDYTLAARVLYGASDRAELGASLSAGRENGISVSGKYRFTDAPATFNLAFGGSATLADHSDSAVDLYLVGTQAFPLNAKTNSALLGTVGVHFINEDSDNTLRPFIGAEYPLGHHTQLAGEYQLRDGNAFKSPLTSVVIRHRLTPVLIGQVGITNSDSFETTRGYHPFIGAQYTFTKGY